MDEETEIEQKIAMSDVREKQSELEIRKGEMGRLVE